MIHLLLYDGDCGFCSRAVRFVLRRDHAAVFRFAPLQGPLAATLLPRFGADPGQLDTLLVVADLGGPGERLLRRGGAVLLVLDSLGGRWRRLGRMLRLVPRPVLDLGYRLVARVRHRLGGPGDRCELLGPELRNRFIGEAEARRKAGRSGA
jgi:predicted DCC family thiol-disulfide oxidoreductase YuxK